MQRSLSKNWGYSCYLNKTLMLAIVPAVDCEKVLLCYHWYANVLHYQPTTIYDSKKSKRREWTLQKHLALRCQLVFQQCIPGASADVLHNDASADDNSQSSYRTNANQSLYHRTSKSNQLMHSYLQDLTKESNVFLYLSCFFILLEFVNILYYHCHNKFNWPFVVVSNSLSYW